MIDTLAAMGAVKSILNLKKYNEERLKQKSHDNDADQYALENTMRIRRQWQKRMRR